MSSNSLKKMIIFSNERIRKVIEGMISDEAIVEKRSASALIEKHLMNDLLPKEASASMWIQFMYEGIWGIGEVLDACFGYLAAGNNWEAKHDNALELVKFAYHWDTMSNTLPDVKALEMHHFLSQLDSVVAKLEDVAEKASSGRYESQKEAEWAKELYRIAVEEPVYMRFANIYQLILNNWGIFKNWSITYRLLSDMAAMQKNWRNTEETRYELTNILKNITNEWD